MMSEPDGAAVEAVRKGERGENVLFRVDRSALADAAGERNVHRLPAEAADRYGFTATPTHRWRPFPSMQMCLP